MSFGTEEIENVPLSFERRARLIELLREEYNSVASGEVSGYSAAREDELAEISEIIELLNTPAGA